MKVKRYKHCRKVLTFYQKNFGFNVPYKVLIDGTFCKAALNFKVNISEQLPKYFKSEVQLCTTECATAECEALGTLLYGPLKVLQQFEILRCGHRPPTTAAKCMLSRIKKNNVHKFMLATQDEELTTAVKKHPGVPLLYIAYNTITLEAPTDFSKQSANEQLNSKMAPSEYEIIGKLKKEMFGEEEITKKKKKKRKGVNPLSCKKKKTRPGLDNAVKNKKKCRKRKRLKATGPITEQLLQSLRKSV
ncbi:rRNA-processing protein UTP23 homolog [Gigantopelta aegis]|uniref:rRNA-processing protein UTP23 homolog n=1 Tax=Gigantopelta aegis TaxID=1735272 RepID=UPI001B88E358|nr:rRNA-processing protein UTP23 homolog [Gigantopelta aegis]XP_041356934.1 rRNA-processing protein UTP23 homolog [Gigantopelta aegis]